MQNLTFCGVGSHHQNSVFERIIKDLTFSSWTLVLHAQRHWTEYITTVCWPFDLVAAADRMNSLHIDIHGQTREMKFSHTIGLYMRLSHFHTFSCPVYILDARLQSVGGGGPPKWDPLARLGIHLGHYPSHAESFALFMNTKTSLVSPQFYLVFDENFETVPHLRAGTVPENWAKLVTNSREKSTEGFYDITKTWFDGELDTTADYPATSIPLVAMLQPSAAMQQPAAKQQSLSAM